MAWNNLFNFLAGGTVGRETRETRELYLRVKAAFEASAYTDDAFDDFRVQCILGACERADRIPIGRLINSMGQLVGELVDLDFLLFGFPEVGTLDALSPSGGVELRTYLRRKERFLANPTPQHGLWQEVVVATLTAILERLPRQPLP